MRGMYKMLVEEYKSGEEKVLFLHKHSFGNIFLDKENLEEIAKVNSLDIRLVNLKDAPEFMVQNRDFIEYRRFITTKVAEKTYDEIYDYVVRNKIKIVIVFGIGAFWSDDFIDRLKSHAYVACYFADDPEGSGYTSEYWVRAYDYAFCAGTDYFYGDNTWFKTVTKQYLEWGARKAKFIPIGLRPVMWKDEPIDHEKKDIDLVYVGANNMQKYFFLAKLKRHFGKRFKIYGRGYGKSTNIFKTFVLSILNKMYGMEGIEPIEQKDIVDIYRRSKIGINKHLSYGISNQRCYELPANEVLQLCDNKHGGEEIFRGGRDIIYYDNVEDAIEKIEFYLKPENEIVRMLIAGHGKLAAMQYTLGKTFKMMLEEIKSDDQYKRFVNV